MSKIESENNNSNFENKINKNYYRFLIREYYSKSTEHLEIASKLTNIFFFKMTDDVKSHYFSVSKK